METIPSPADIASRLPKNQGEVGDRIVYRDPTTLLIEDMLIEGYVRERNGIHRVYLGSGNRVVHSRHVREVKKSQ